MYKTKNLGLNVTEIGVDANTPFSFDIDLGDNFKAIDEKTISHRNITNCLLEVPQDIKLELIDGAITLKAGSKAYVPNGLDDSGDKLFATLTANSDATIKEYGTGKLFLYLQTNGGLATAFMTGSTITDYPDTPIDFTLYYNSSTNEIILHQNNSWVTDCSFPIAVVTRSETGFVSIDQVFNGFGYIGSTVFALPGVKGLIPNGRNEDGSLKSILYTSDKVFTRTISIAPRESFCLAIAPTASSQIHVFEQYHISNYIPLNAKQSSVWLDLNSNMQYRYNNDEWRNDASFIDNLYYAKFTMDNQGHITYFAPKHPFQAVEFNDYQAKITELETKIQTLQTAIEALQV